jgi:peptidoglycan hydrolase-like protein with peptidoglycan-binding domain
MPSTKTVGIAIGAVLLAGVAVTGGIWAFNATQAKASSGQNDALHSAAGTTTVPVVRRDLASRINVTGTLGYADQGQLVSQARGTLTAIAAEGSIVQRGQTLLEVDGHPVVLFYGDRPAWRPFTLGMSDGPDVKQLEQNLIALGYASSSSLSADGHFDVADVAAIKRWQKAMGLTQTGSIDLGQIVFQPGAVRIGTHQAQVGSPAAGLITAISSTTRIVTVDLDASKQSLVKVGDAVRVTLPNSGKSTTGTVSSISSVAQTTGQQQNQRTTVRLTISLTDPASTGSLDAAPVNVGIATDSVKNVLAVPINALLALNDGGYAVEVDQNGSRHLVPVKTGLFDDSDSLVEISGSGIDAGTNVVIPQ